MTVATRPTDPAGPLPRASRARRPNRSHGGLRRAPRRRRPRPPLPDGLRGAAARAADDARHRARRGSHPPRRPSPGGAGRPGGMPDGDPDRDVGGDRECPRPRRLDRPRPRWRGCAPPRRLGSALGVPPARAPARAGGSWLRVGDARAQVSADDEGRRRDRVSPPRGPGRRPGRRPDRGRSARRANGGGRRSRGARAAHRRGPRGGPLRDRRVRAELCLAAPRGIGAGHPGRRADRPRHRRDARRVRQRHHPDAVGHGRRCREGSGRGVPAPVQRAVRGPGERDEGRPPGCRLRGDRRDGPRTSSTPRATARRSSIGRATASGSRATRTRTWSPATPSRSPKAWRSASSQASTCPAVTGRGSRTSSSAAQTARSSSTKHHAT